MSATYRKQQSSDMKRTTPGRMYNTKHTWQLVQQRLLWKQRERAEMWNIKYLTTMLRQQWQYVILLWFETEMFSEDSLELVFFKDKEKSFYELLNQKS